MKRLLVCTLSLLLLATLPEIANAQNTQYVRVYTLIQEADQLMKNAETESAHRTYLEAQKELQRMQVAFPNWNASVVKFRLDYVGGRLEGLGPQSADATAIESSSQTVSQVRADGVDEEIRRLRSDQIVLEAKLKEALAARPAALNPQELARAEEKIRLLEKEKELLSLALETEKAKSGGDGESSRAEELNAALSQANEKISEQAEAILAVNREKQILETRLHAATQRGDARPIPKVESQEAKDQRAQVGVSPGVIPTVPVGSMKADTGDAAVVQIDDAEVGRLQMAFQTLEEEKAVLEKVKVDLEAKLASATADPESQASRVRRIEGERDELLKKLNETTRQLYDNKARTELVEREQYESQLEILRARLEVFEARTVPFSPEELALFKKPDPSLAKTDAKTGNKSRRELPRGAQPLVADAERAFAARRFDEAAEKYREILRLDSQSVYALANLAAIELQQNRLTEAEGHLNRAMGFDPSDTHSMTLMGILRFGEQRFDEALDLLSRAAQVDPTNPETQNYLGITLSHKGQRGPAETALRRAIQLAPNYGGAHQNLAVIYATQQPPFRELARWHYQKSLATGHPANAEIEKLIEEDSASVKAE